MKESGFPSPVASVIIITYNSEKYVVETLESIKDQTYYRVELIISDDSSTDNTVEVCKDWLKKNKDRFIRSELVTVETNTGISANCNRGAKAATGEWIKFIAGDDALITTCIEDNMRHVLKNPGINVLFSYCRFYIGDLIEANFERLIPATAPSFLMNDTITAVEQYRILLLGDRISYTPSYFIQRQALKSVGGFDEKYKLMEDYPMWLKLTSAGYKLHFMPKETVRYRRHPEATHNMSSKLLIRPAFFRSEAFRKEYIYPNVSWDIRFNEKFRYYVSFLFRTPFLNQNKPFNRWLLKVVTRWMNPFAYITYFKKKTVSKR